MERLFIKELLFFPFQLQMEPELNAKKTHGIITVRVLQRKKWPHNIWYTKNTNKKVMFWTFLKFQSLSVFRIIYISVNIFERIS